MTSKRTANNSVISTLGRASFSSRQHTRQQPVGGLRLEIWQRRARSPQAALAEKQRNAVPACSDDSVRSATSPTLEDDDTRRQYRRCKSRMIFDSTLFAPARRGADIAAADRMPNRRISGAIVTQSMARPRAAGIGVGRNNGSAQHIETDLSWPKHTRQIFCPR